LAQVFAFLLQPCFEFKTSSAATMKAAAILLLATSAAAVSLTKESWDAAVAGKSVFIKFQAPW